jgi:hypothetical protein
VSKRGDRRTTHHEAAAGGPSKHKWLENFGLIVIVILILAITITRYWQNIHWSMR